MPEPHADVFGDGLEDAETATIPSSGEEHEGLLVPFSQFFLFSGHLKGVEFILMEVEPKLLLEVEGEESSRFTYDTYDTYVCMIWGYRTVYLTFEGWILLDRVFSLSGRVC